VTAVFPQGSNYRSFTTVHSDSSATTLYTAGPGVLAAYFVWINLSDDAADARTYTLTFTDSSGSTTATLMYQKAMAANVQIKEDFFVAMETGDTLTGTASASGVHAVVTIHEVSGRRG
jgi:hypothetical protein